MATIPAIKVPFTTTWAWSNSDCRDELNLQTKPGASHYPKCQEATACVMILKVSKRANGAQGLRWVPAMWASLVGSTIQVDGGPGTWLVCFGGRELGLDSAQRWHTVKTYSTTKRRWADMAWEAYGTAIERHLRESIWQFLRKSNTELPYDPAILLRGVPPREWKAGLKQTLVC